VFRNRIWNANCVLVSEKTSRHAILVMFSNRVVCCHRAIASNIVAVVTVKEVIGICSLTWDNCGHILVCEQLSAVSWVSCVGDQIEYCINIIEAISGHW
jgi:hypothetical protein